MWFWADTLAGFGTANAGVSLVRPDYKSHPKVVDIDEVEAILAESFEGRA